MRDEVEAVHPPAAGDIGSRGHRVALITSSFAPHVGGVETHVARVAEELTRDGIAVEVWAVDRAQRSTAHDAGGYRVRYLATPLPARDMRSLWRFALLAPRAWAAWRQARREFAPSVVHVHCFGPNGVYGAALSRRFRIPLVLTSHGETRADDDNAFGESVLLRTALRRSIARANAVTAPSDFVLRDLRDRFGLEDGLVIPNGVESVGDEVSVAPTPGAPYLLGVGRLGWNKGFDLLISAFAAARLPADLRLMIVGDGPELSSLTEAARALGVQGRVEFPGRLDPGAVAAAMAGATAVVVPSRVEAFGIVALEAWRSGAPLVMTNRGGAREFVRDGEDALLVDPTRVDDLARALERVALDNELRRSLAAAGGRRWPDYTWARAAAQYGAVYDRIVTSTRSGSGEVG